jgi:RNA polymerase sigma-70 factor (ECF subfamily)
MIRPEGIDVVEFRIESKSWNPSGGVSTVDDTQAELLVRLLSRHQDDLFRYIFALVPREEDARDILQETCVALLRKFAEYDPSKPFLPWAFRFASMEVLKFRDRANRQILLFRQELLTQLAEERADRDTMLHLRLQALDDCLRQLPPADRRLIGHRYHRRTPIESLVQMLGYSRRTLFRHLDRIRRVLLECISRRLGSSLD